MSSPSLRRFSLVLWLALAVVATLVTVRSWPREPLAARIAHSTAVFDHKGRLLRLTLAEDEQYRLWTPLEVVSPQFVEALLLHEDQHFYRHPGLNPASLARAAFSTYTGAARAGGSTITMQLARLLYGLNTRTIGGKLTQIGRAVQLELLYSKHDLLEAHVNLLPYGGNVQGVGTASQIYFGKPANKLGLAESLTLVLIPQSPSRRGPTDDEPADLRAARERLFVRWREAHPQADSTHQYVSLPLHYRRLSDLPFAAPHFVDYVLRERARPANLTSAAAVPVTTLDLPLQRLTERVIANYVREQRDIGIHNAAALLVDYRDLSVRAMVGSADFHSATIQGQVNGTLAKRSPGSALKPFIYALAIDQGADPSADRTQGRTGFLRSLQPGEFRWPLRRSDHRDGRTDPLAQRACGRALGTALTTGLLSIPAGRGHLADGFRKPLRPGAGAGGR